MRLIVEGTDLREEWEDLDRFILQKEKIYEQENFY